MPSIASFFRQSPSSVEFQGIKIKHILFVRATQRCTRRSKPVYSDDIFRIWLSRLPGLLHGRLPPPRESYARRLRPPDSPTRSRRRYGRFFPTPPIRIFDTFPMSYLYLFAVYVFRYLRLISYSKRRRRRDFQTTRLIITPPVIKNAVVLLYIRKRFFCVFPGQPNETTIPPEISLWPKNYTVSNGRQNRFPSSFLDRKTKKTVRYFRLLKRRSTFSKYPKKRTYATIIVIYYFVFKILTHVFDLSKPVLFFF